jgi:dipeptidyl aminopeptidase/acylaminoacyl peptidase
MFDQRLSARTAVVFAAVLSIAIPAAAQTKQPITHEVLWQLPRVGTPAVSPDGKWVVFSVLEPAYDSKQQTSDLWIVAADGSGEPARLTATKAAESGVAWSPDSRRIAFVTKREGDEESQLYTLNITGGEATRVTNVVTGAAAPQWRPDGRALLFTSLVYPGARDDADNKRMAEERKNRKYSVRTFETYPVRRWDRWFDERQLHVLVQPLDAGAKAVDLLAGTALVQNAGYGGRDLDTGEELDAVWAPDGRSVVFAATTNRNQAVSATVHTHLYQIPAGGGEPRQLTSGNASYDHPTFAADGRTLYFSTTDDHDQIYSLTRVAAASWPWSGQPRILTAAFDRSVSTWALSSDGRTLYLTAEDEGLEKVYSMPAGGGQVSLLVAPERGVYTNLVSSTGAPTLVANWGSSIEPSEIVRIDPATKTHRRLTSFAVERAAAIDWRPLQHFTFNSSRGRRIHSMIALPANFDPARKYPLLVLIHGGFANMWRDAITLRWNYHLLARPGYVVLMTNYTGSTGFGEQFARAIKLDPFAGPASEINEAADAAISRFPFIDGTRQAAAGASYGGHLANWLEGTTTRYKALISHAGLVNSEAQWGTSDDNYGRELMAGGPPWLQTPTWREQNPIRHAANFKTPMLLSIGENDFRVPINNTLEMWSALQRMKVPGRLLVWPNANHWITHGEDSRHFYEEVHSWLGRWLATAATTTASVAR